jgi:hypothetical protein
MKKQNSQRQALLQKKRTKRNQSRKNVKYNPNKMAQRQQAFIQEGTAPSNAIPGEATIVL